MKIIHIFQVNLTKRQTTMKLLKIVDRVSIGLSLVLFLLAGLSDITSGKPLIHDLAIKGYDAVAYFTIGKALQGNEAFTFYWHDMTWNFSNKENMVLFAANPEKYAPQYDGYCAWAMTEGQKAETDPEVWKIVDGKLYLSCSSSAYEKWSKDVPGNIKRADKYWLKLQNKEF
jgi:hypothetical protein